MLRLGQKRGHRLMTIIVSILNWLKNFTHRLSNKPFSIWLLTTPPHLKCVATLPCSLSLMACLDDNNVSQGSVATYTRCSGIFDTHLTVNLPRNLAVKKFLKSVKIWLNYGHESVAPFFGPPCIHVKAILFLYFSCLTNFIERFARL